MAASSSLTASAPHFCCPRRRGVGVGVSPLWSCKFRETRKHTASSTRYFQRIDQKASLTIISRTTQFRCRATTMEVALANETLLTGEEAVITAAAAEAVALARAAFEVAQEAVRLSETSDFSNKPGPQALSLESTLSITDKIFQNPFDGGTIQIQEEVSSSVDYVKVKVASTRQHERRARRQRATEKVAGVATVKLGVSKKKTQIFRENDSKDPVKMFKRIAGAYKALTMAEEKELSEGVQDLLRLKAIEKELKEQYGQDPSFAMWAAAAEIDQRTLRRRLEHSMHCKEKMIKCNIRLVVSIARNFTGAGYALEDLVQEGCRGLVKAVEKFDGSKGFKFSTYAHWWIKQAIRKSLSEKSRLIHLPFSLVNASFRVREAIKELRRSERKLKDIDTSEIAKLARVTEKMVKTVMLLPKTPKSLDAMIGWDKNVKLSDTIPCHEEDSLSFIMNKESIKLGIKRVLDTLTAREKMVVRWRYGLEDGRAKTLQEIGDIIGISRERVRQIESCAFRKLKSKKRVELLQGYVKAYGSGF
ncbi:hypothetical protein LUZ63_017453 [Rhynchospora breviuscula]|uniref:RNA polymerase sigma-70 domain-containing protein n=1 Tax=Rhynchospora breviuscula TaxID=2022672 RepID=A0A9Q0C2H4_9POAL|nr:hypothetical protein LUZ63_017453 [Rhynchospora breviuscula]